MKKFLCLLLTLVLTLALASCNQGNTGDNNNDNDNTSDNTDNGNGDNTTDDGKGDNTTDDENKNEEQKDPFAVLEDAVKNVNPKAIVLDVVTETELGTLNAKYEIYHNEDGSAVINYSYERFLMIGEDTSDNEIVKTVTGTVARDKDGKYTPDTSVDLGAIEAALGIDISTLKSAATINDAGDMLTVTVSKLDSETVLGTQLNSDASLKITLDGEDLKTIVIKVDGATYTYSYSK